MKAKLTAVFDELRGKTGNVVAKQSPSGQIMMIRSIGTDPRTQTQIQSRTLMNAIAKQWKNLTQDQRGSWNREAINAQSGYGLFFGRNANLNSIGQPFLTYFVRPVAFTDDIIIHIPIDIENRIFQIDMTVTGSQENDFLRIKISRFTNRKLSRDSYKLRNVTYMPIDATQTVNIFEDIVKINKGEPARRQYAYMQFDKVSSKSGYAEIFNTILLEWNNSYVGYMPIAEVSIDQNACTWNTNTLIANIKGSAVVKNYENDYPPSQDIYLNVYNRPEGSDKYISVLLSHRDTFVQNANIDMSLIEPFAKAFYPAGTTKYWAIESAYTDEGYGNQYSYESERFPITAT